MKVDITNLREVLFDCPWQGHLADPDFLVVNSSAPNVIGLRCLKCGCLVYINRPTSPVVGPDGEALPASGQTALTLPAEDVKMLPPGEVN